ncbi:hypothetical protein HDU81_004909 [Chytriomyces hyalinus]|nr:hypothetical protein HDU81_004909 [Chytriomyces hyalinus]
MQIVSIALSLFVALLTASQVAAKCPLEGRCPYVAQTESTGRTDCPLKTGNCPYYFQHAKDASVADYLTAKDGKCPLEGKCTFYQDIKDGKAVDLSGSKCPIKDTCPYYKTVKSHGDNVECPLEKSCPRNSISSQFFPSQFINFKKDFKNGGHAHHASKGDSHSAKDCPYLKKQKESANSKESAPETEPTKCPMKGKCPYADKHGSANGDGGAGCPLKDGGCPYYKDHAGGKDLGVGEGCPLKDKCPYYEDIKSGKTVDFSKNDCPLAEKCPYYKEAKEKGADGGCPATKGCPHFNKDVPASGDVKNCPYHQKKDAGAGQQKKSACPLHGKCPYVDNHHTEHGKGCPLQKGGCPYFDEHKRDKDVADVLLHDGGCPLKEKCPYYEDMKSGKKVDFSGNKCPLAEKCPYYKEVKEGGVSPDCPLEKCNCTLKKISKKVDTRTTAAKETLTTQKTGLEFRAFVFGLRFKLIYIVAAMTICSPYLKKHGKASEKVEKSEGHDEL